MLTISKIDHDPRVNKVAGSLAQRGYRVDIIAPADNRGYAEYEVQPGVRYVRVPVRMTGRFALIYQDEFRQEAVRRSFDFVHANDLTTLTLAYLLARHRGISLIYDAHELWTENVEFKDQQWVPMSRLTRLIAGVWERLLVRSVDLVITVGPSIVGEFQRRGGLRQPPLLLPNYPSLALTHVERDAPTIRAECGLSDAHFVTLYLGGVNPLRNIETVIEAHQHLPANHVFVIKGPGVETDGDYYLMFARNLGLGDRVFALPPVAMDEVIAVAVDADCGIVMLRNICKNFFLFYPNKLFEYALAGLPVAASAFPDVASFIRNERCGVTFDPDSPTSIAAAIRRLSTDPEEARAMGERGRASIVERHNWETASRALLSAYDSLQ